MTDDPASDKAPLPLQKHCDSDQERELRLERLQGEYKASRQWITATEQRIGRGQNEQRKR